MSVRRCPYCRQPAGPHHTGCTGLFGELMRSSPSPAPEDLPPEALVHAEDPERRLNQFILVEAVGRGGMGVVWKAWDRRLARWVAIKFLHGSLAGDAARFEREARLAAALQHPNIAPVIELGETPKRYIALAYVDGPPLSAATLGPREAAAVFVKVARAVDAAHRAGVLHRDLKPGNILLSRDGWPYVTDFGLARRIDGPSSVTPSGDVLGTPAFMAPEQAEGSPAGVRSDVYSLGASLYAVLCGRAPYDGENALAILSQVVRRDPEPPRRIRPDVSPALEAVVMRALRRTPELRYATAGELADDLERYLADAPVQAARSHPVWPAFAATLLAAALVVVLWKPPAAVPSPPSPEAAPDPADAARETIGALLLRADEVPRATRDADRARIAGLARSFPELAALAATYPADPPAVDRIDLAACLRSPDPEAACGRLERELGPLAAREDLSRESRRAVLTAIVVAGAWRRLLAGRSEAEAAEELAGHGAALREAGGPADPQAYGPRVAAVLEKILSRK